MFNLAKAADFRFLCNGLFKTKRMEQAIFDRVLEELSPLLERIRLSAHDLHAAVNQTYDGRLPYAVHLDAVAGLVRRYGAAVCASEDDVAPLLFGAWYHDSMEDARLTYNDVKKRAVALGLSEGQALTAAEIVYALTNDKGRTRAERAGEKYYAGIRATPYAPLVKMADRTANAEYSARNASGVNLRMREVYRREMPKFLASIHAGTDDVRMAVPESLVACACEALAGD